MRSSPLRGARFSTPTPKIVRAWSALTVPLVPAALGAQLDKTFSAETLPPRGEETKDSADEDPSGAAVEEGGAGASAAGSTTAAGTAVGDAAAVACDEAPAVSLEEGKE